MPRMGHPPQQPPYSLGRGFESLQPARTPNLELLPFKDARQFHEWLSGPFVRGSWTEYQRDFLSRNPASPEPDKTKTAQAAKDAINGKNPKFLVYHPEKDSWGPEDHTVRFIATVVNDNMIKNLWSESDWKKRGVDITKAVDEVLSFLRATTAREQQFLGSNPPRYED